MKKRILVFPCGSETGLEIHRSMAFSTHFELIGASSVPDHGRFVYEEHVGNLPFHDDPAFPERLAEVVRTQAIDAIYPTMDAVAETVQGVAGQLGCRIIGSSLDTTRTCASKRATYDAVADLVPVPSCYASVTEVPAYPIFVKPDRGYGSRNAIRADDAEGARAHLARHPETEMLLLEFLPGKEWTVDCFSDRHGELRYHAPRGRNRITNGISVNTSPSDEFAGLFAHWAAAINERLRPRGAWFFQARQDGDGRPRLLEVAARFAGSSGLQRGLGVNLPMLAAFDAFDMAVSVAPNRYPIELDRALENRFRLGIDYTQVFVDLDDCLLLEGRINHQLVGFLYKSLSAGKKLTLLTRHSATVDETLSRHRLREVFDRVIQITNGRPKSHYIDASDAIFIDDSFRERSDVSKVHGIPVFSPDMIECLL